MANEDTTCPVSDFFKVLAAILPCFAFLGEYGARVKTAIGKRRVVSAWFIVGYVSAKIDFCELDL